MNSQRSEHLAARHTPGRRTDFWAAPDRDGRFWTSHDGEIEGVMLDPTPDIAEDINALRPFSTLPVRPSAPFVR